jgi:ATP-dependent helicase HepA
MEWQLGDRLRHRFNPDLGPGLISAIEGRTVVVEFPNTGAVLRLAATSDAIEPLEIREGTRGRLLSTGEEVVVQLSVGDGRARLSDGRIVDERDVWPMDVGDSLIDRLAQGQVDRLERFALRLDSLHLATVREADGLGSFLGGRIQLFPHQLHAAERATRTDPVRWLLADEVGLGKTVEACLILNHLLRTGRADRTVVVAPDTLTVQWLGELWRKYHQVFVLLDEKRLVDVEKVYGQGFNPFEAHRRVVVSLETLVERPHLSGQAVEAGVDLLIVDEAHHLRRPPGHPGDEAYRAVAPIAGLGRHVLLLTATPLEDDAHGFFRLLQLLRPEEFPEEIPIEERLSGGEPLPPCTSAARRADIGGLPPRRPVRVDIDLEAWAPMAELERAVRALPAPHVVARNRKARRIRRAQASGAALDALLDTRTEQKLRKIARRASSGDPRIDWLVRTAPEWRRARDKTLVFVAQRESLELIRTALSRQAQMRVGLFHEDLSPGQRDIEVAQFRLPGGPSMLVSTECGGEGRNFEVCTRMVLFDLPWDPMLVEQRIGRLDRIGRTRDVEIVYFRPPSGLGAAVADLYREIGLFERPLGGLGRELATVEDAIEELALSDADIADASRFTAIVEDARDAWDRVQQAAYHELHREPYTADLAEGILERIPPELDEQIEEVVLAACEHLGLHVESHRGVARYSIEFGNQARVESLPGVPGDSNFLGSFDREEALRDESIDFYASGHPLVEGILAHLDDSPRGRVTLLHAAGAEGEEGFGVLAIYKNGPQFEPVAIDIEGVERPEWAERLTRRPLRSKRVSKDSWTLQPGWPTLIRSLAKHLEGRGRPVAVAAFRIGG